MTLIEEIKERILSKLTKIQGITDIIPYINDNTIYFNIFFNDFNVFNEVDAAIPYNYHLHLLKSKNIATVEIPLQAPKELEIEELKQLVATADKMLNNIRKKQQVQKSERIIKVYAFGYPDDEN